MSFDDAVPSLRDPGPDGVRVSSTESAWDWLVVTSETVGSVSAADMEAMIMPDAGGESKTEGGRKSRRRATPGKLWLAAREIVSVAVIVRGTAKESVGVGSGSDSNRREHAR